MPQINGRSLEQVRRYDLFKLAVAVLLFIAWLFFTDRIPLAPTGPGPGAADVAADSVARPVPTRLRIEATGGGVRLQGSVPDEATRDEYVAAARKALGRPDRVDDRLDVAAGAGRPRWLSHVAPAISALAGHDGVSATIDADQVLLEGRVADDAHRTGIADAVTAAFGAPFTVVNRLAIAEPDPGATRALQVDPAPVSVFFEEGVTAVSVGDGEKLGALARHARETGASLHVSGFHSRTGAAQRNAEIAKERAVAVRELLVGLGVAPDRVVLDKPREALGEGDDRRARRVDVGIGED